MWIECLFVLFAAPYFWYQLLTYFFSNNKFDDSDDDGDVVDVVLRQQPLTFLERFTISIPFGTVSTVWPVLFLHSLQNEMTSSQPIYVAIVHLILGFIISRARQHNHNSFVYGFKTEIFPNYKWFLMASFAPMAVSYIMYTHLLPLSPNGNLLVGGNVYSDLPFHLTVLNSFLYGINSRPQLIDPKGVGIFLMEEAIFTGERLVYPLVPDYFVAIFIKIGWSIRMSLLMPSLLMTWSFFYILYAATLRFTKGSNLAALVTIILTISSGGNYKGTEPPFWLYFVKDIFLPQRSAMYAYTVTLGCFIVLWTGLDCLPVVSNFHDDVIHIDDHDDDNEKQQHHHQHQHQQQQQQKKQYKRNMKKKFVYMDSDKERFQLYILSGFLAGTLPFLQGHAFISVCLITAVTLAVRHLPEFFLTFDIEMLFSNGMYWLGPAIFFGLPQMTAFMSVAGGSGFMKAQMMWVDYQGNNEGFLHWMWTSLGVYIYLAIIAFGFGTARQKFLLLGFWFLFFLCLFFKFQPWKVDNMKLFYIWYFVANMSIGQLCDWQQRTGNLFISPQSFENSYQQQQQQQQLQLQQQQFQKEIESNKSARKSSSSSSFSSSFVAVDVSKVNSTKKIRDGKKPLQHDDNVDDDVDDDDDVDVDVDLEKNKRAGNSNNNRNSSNNHKPPPRLLPRLMIRMGWIILIVAIAFPGIYNILFVEFPTQFPLLYKADIEAAEWVKENTAFNAVFLTDASHNHPIPTLAGRNVYIGYKGWLSSRNYKYGPRVEIARQIFGGHVDTPNLMREEGIDYVAITKNEGQHEHVNVNYEYLNENLKKVFENNVHVIYQSKEKNPKRSRFMFGSLYHDDEDEMAEKIKKRRERQEQQKNEQIKNNNNNNEKKNLEIKI